MDHVIIYKLSENEAYDTQWRTIGLFTTLELAEQFRDNLRAEMKSQWDDKIHDFEDWYKHLIFPVKLYGKLQ